MENSVPLYSLTPTCYTLLSSFLSQEELVRLAAVSRTLREIVFQYWRVLSVVDGPFWENRIQWATRYLGIIKPETLEVLITQKQTDQQLQSFCLQRMPYISTLILHCQSEPIHITLSLACSNATTLEVSSRVLTDKLLTVMCRSMANLHTLRVKKDDLQFTCTQLSTCLTEALERLELKCHLADFEEVEKLVRKCWSNLVELELDIEECQQQLLLDILSQSKNLEELRLFHCQHLSSSEKIAQAIPNKLSGLTLTKCKQMSLDSLLMKQSTPHLVELNLTEAALLTHQLFVKFIEGAKNLRRVNLSWCNGLNSNSIRHLIKKCPQLRILNITGIKQVRDEAFEGYYQLLPYFDEKKFNVAKYEQSNIIQSVKPYEYMIDPDHLTQFLQISTLSKLKILACISCNYPSDKILKLIYLRWPKIQIYDYYENLITLF